MSRIVHVSHQMGDDQLGDGSIECPVRSQWRGRQIAGPGDLLCVDGFIGAPGPSARTKLAVAAGILAGSWLLILLAAHNPLLAAFVGGSVAILCAALLDEKPNAKAGQTAVGQEASR